MMRSNKIRKALKIKAVGVAALSALFVASNVSAQAPVSDPRKVEMRLN